MLHFHNIDIKIFQIEKYENGIQKFGPQTHCNTPQTHPTHTHTPIGKPGPCQGGGRRFGFNLTYDPEFRFVILTVNTFIHKVIIKRKVVFISCVLFSYKLSLFYILEVISNKPNKQKDKKETGGREGGAIPPSPLCVPDL